MGKIQIKIPRNFSERQAVMEAERPVAKGVGKLGVVMVLLVGIGIGYGWKAVGSGGAPRSASKKSISIPWRRGSRADWWNKAEANGFKVQGARYIMAEDKRKFLDRMGEPDRTQILGNEAYWTYQCSDGQIQLVISLTALDMEGMVISERVNEF